MKTDNVNITYIIGLLARKRLYRRLVTQPAKAKGVSSAEYLHSRIKNVPVEGWVHSLIPDAVLPTDERKKQLFLKELQEALTTYQKHYAEGNNE